MDLVAAGLVLQGFARWNHAMALSRVAHDNLSANNIYRNGNEQQRRKYLPDLCAGRTIGALGLTEPGAGSDALGSMRTTARRDGDHYVLNGGKIFITNGPVADVILVYAKTDRARGAHGITAFIVEKDFPGFKVAQKLTKMGYRGSQTAELVFEDCRVPAEDLVGGENRGVSIVMSGLDLERAMVAPLCLGVSERALQLSIEYAQTRQQFGKPIGSFQMVQSMLAEMYVQVETMRTFTYRTLAEAAPLEIGGGGRGDIHMLTAASVMYAAGGMPRRPRQGRPDPWRQRLHLGSEINRLFRSIKLLEIGAGTTEVRKMIIAGEPPQGRGFPVADDQAPERSDRLGPTDDELALHRTVFAFDALKDMVIVLSGGAGGIGRASGLFARPRRARVVVVGRDRGKLSALTSNMAAKGLKASACAADVRELDAVARLFDAVWQAHGRVDGLINSAGGQFPQPAIDFSVKGWNAVIDTNLNGTWYMMQTAARHWRDNKSSRQHRQHRRRTTHGATASRIRSPPDAGLSASRAALPGMGPAQHPGELRRPGAIETEGWSVYTPEARAAYPRSNPMMRAGSPWMSPKPAPISQVRPGRSSPAILTVDGGGQLWERPGRPESRPISTDKDT